MIPARPLALALLAAGALSACAHRPEGAAPDRGPWRDLARADAAHRALDPAAEARALLAVVAAEPRHPLATVAVRRLDDLADLAPPIAREVDAGLAAALGGGKRRLQGLAAFRARAARAAIAEAEGDLARGAALRAENGAVTGWTLLGPLGALHALELDRVFGPEQGPLPERTAGAPGVGEVAARAIPVPDGMLTLEGEPAGADLWILAADVTVREGGDYLAVFGSSGSLRAWLDGEPLAERRAHEGWLPLAQAVPRRLAPGAHRLVVKLARGQSRGNLAVAFGRADGAPADVTTAPARPGTASPRVKEGPFPAPAFTARELARALEADAPAAWARLVAARDAADVDREVAKRLLAEARAAKAPLAQVEALAAELAFDDPTLPERTGRARAEGALSRAVAADPADAAIRLDVARFALDAERVDDALAALDALPPAARDRPAALVVRARAEASRGFAAGAERHAERAHREASLCGATELLWELAGKRDAIALQDELAVALGRCSAGARRVPEHRLRRGDVAGALAVREAQARAAPSRFEPRLALAAALLAAGDPLRAAREWEDLARLWPRDPRIPKRRADALEAAGDAKGARAAREHALALDGSDLALRRALALEDGREPLDDLAEDGDAALAAYRKAAPREETSSVYVLDAAAAEVNPDGSMTERVHQIVKVRDERAADHYGEVPLPPGAQVVRLRTVKRDGRVLEPELVTAADHERNAVSLPGLEPGDFAEWEWLRGVPSRGPALPGFTSDGFLFAGEAPLWRSRFALRAPAGAGVEVEARAMPAPEVRREGAYEVLRAGADAAPAVLDEPAAPDEVEFLPNVRAGAGARPLDLGRALGDGFVDRTRPTVEIEQLAREIAATVPAGERGGEALVRAAYAHLAQGVLGTGGSFAEPASHVLARGRGSRLVLLAAVLRALGVDARLALVREFQRDQAPARFPRGDLWSRPVLRVAHGGKVWWLDPSQRLAPFGALPGGARGAEALVLAGPGAESELARLPDPGPDARDVEVRIAVADDGSAVADGVEVYRGWDAASAKTGLEKADEQERRQAVEGALARSFRGVALEALAIEGEKDPEAPLVVRWRAKVASFARVDEGHVVADAPIFPAKLGGRYAPRARRETPLLVAADDAVTLRVTVTAPPGWRAVPQPRDVASAYGSLKRVDRATPEGLLREERFTLKRARVAPEAYGPFAAFANAVDAAQAAPIVFEKVQVPTT